MDLDSESGVNKNATEYGQLDQDDLGSVQITLPPSDGGPGEKGKSGGRKNQNGNLLKDAGGGQYLGADRFNAYSGPSDNK